MMTKSEAISLMLDGETLYDESFYFKFEDNKFLYKTPEDDTWRQFNPNAKMRESVCIYTPPKRTEKRWLWLIKRRYIAGYEEASHHYYPSYEAAREDLNSACEVIKPLDGTNGTWNSEIEVEQ